MAGTRKRGIETLNVVGRSEEETRKGEMMEMREVQALANPQRLPHHPTR